MLENDPADLSNLYRLASLSEAANDIAEADRYWTKLLDLAIVRIRITLEACPDVFCKRSALGAMDMTARELLVAWSIRVCKPLSVIPVERIRASRDARDDVNVLQNTAGLQRAKHADGK